MINIAVIGAGYWGTKLIGEYLALSKKRKDVRLDAVADASPEELCRISKTLSLPNSMLKRDYCEILEDPETTAIHIATPNETHYEIAMKAIAAGKHVLLEKPMALSSGDAFKLARCAEKHNSVLLIGHIFRFNNAINKIKELVEKKEIDGTRCVEMRWTSLMPPPVGRDIIFDLAPHPIDILNHIFEEWPTQVYVNAHSYVRKKIGMEEVAFATLNFPQDIVILIVLSWIHHGPIERTVSILTERNRIEIEAVNQRIKLYEKDSETGEIPINRNNTIESEIDHFVERIKSNDPPINSALTGIMNVSVMEAMRKSVRECKAVTVSHT